MADARSEEKSEEKGSSRGAKETLEDDEREFVIVPEDKMSSPTSSRKQGLSIDLSLAAIATEQRSAAKDISEEDRIMQV